MIIRKHKEEIPTYSHKTEWISNKVSGQLVQNLNFTKLKKLKRKIKKKIKDIWKINLLTSKKRTWSWTYGINPSSLAKPSLFFSAMKNCR